MEPVIGHWKRKVLYFKYVLKTSGIGIRRELKYTYLKFYLLLEVETLKYVLSLE